MSRPQTSTAMCASSSTPAMRVSNASSSSSGCNSCRSLTVLDRPRLLLQRYYRF